MGCVDAVFVFVLVDGVSNLFNLEPPATSCKAALTLTLVAFFVVEFGGTGRRDTGSV